MDSTVVGLQQHLHVFRDTAKRLLSTLTNLKSFFVFFINGGYIAVKEKWFYDGKKLRIVNKYKYLDIILDFLTAIRSNAEEELLRPQYPTAGVTVPFGVQMGIN